MKKAEIHIMAWDASQQSRLTQDSADDWAPDWSPVLDKVVYTSLTGDGEWRIYAMGADGSGAVDLGITAASALYPAWSPNGAQIAFSDSGIFVIDADGSDLRTVLSGQGQDPSWSPDGSKIAFAAYSGGNWDVFAVNADGSGLTPLTNDTASDKSPAWSPDGARVAFASDRDGDWEIYVMNADGSNQTRLTYSAGWDWGPVWAPDGSQIAFTDAARNVVVMDDEGGNRTVMAQGYTVFFSP